mgnify:CR=1 FL=1
MPVKFVGLLVLFAFCTVWCLYELAQRQSGRQRVSSAWHALMAIVMLLMVAGPTWKGLTSILPSSVLAVIFGVGALWFAWLAWQSKAVRHDLLHHLGMVAMFAAMTWHLAAMAVMAGLRSMPSQPMSPASPSMDHSMGSGSMGSGSMGSGSMGSGSMGGMEAMAAAGKPGGVLWFFALIGVPLMAYLLFASVQAIGRLVRSPGAGADEHDHSCHVPRPVGSLPYRLSALSDFAMNFGMFWMSTGIMVPLLPFFASLSF